MEKYQKGLLDCYGNLKLDSLDKDGSAYNQLKLWQILVPQNVRQVHERLPQIYEIPKEHQKRLTESNQLDAELTPEELERDKAIYELCDRAINDPFQRQENWENNPRQVALEAIVKQRPNHPQTLELLRDRAENDSDEKVRDFARRKLRK